MKSRSCESARQAAKRSAFRYLFLVLVEEICPAGGSFQPLVRYAGMPTYKVLILSANQLVRWESFEAPDDLAAVKSAPPCEEGGKIEIWRGNQRLAKITCAAQAAP